MTQPITKCPICDSPNLSDLIELRNLPIYCNLLWEKQQEARDCPKGDIRLAFCNRCGGIVNVVFDASKLGYSQDYENSLHYSSRFQSYIEALANRLIEQHNLHKKTIIEIGCGKGDFLVLLCEQGNNSGVGFDSSYVERPEHEKWGDRIQFIQDFYTEKYASYQGDFICCRQVLEHVQKPANLLTPLRKTLNDNSQTVFFEVPNALYTINNLMIWDIIYEHCTYFTPPSLSYAFAAAGYTTDKTTEEFGGQFLSIEAHPKTNHLPKAHTSSIDKAAVARLAANIANFKHRFQTQTQQWETHLADIFQQDKKVAIWGSGSKGVTFLNLLKQGKKIDCAVDINPRKQGKFIPGTGQQIVPPEHLKSHPVEVVIVMNPLYKDEIASTLNGMGLSPQILTTESF